MSNTDLVPQDEDEPHDIHTFLADLKRLSAAALKAKYDVAVPEFNVNEAIEDGARLYEGHGLLSDSGYREKYNLTPAQLEELLSDPTFQQLFVARAAKREQGNIARDELAKRQAPVVVNALAAVITSPVSSNANQISAAKLVLDTGDRKPDGVAGVNVHADRVVIVLGPPNVPIGPAPRTAYWPADEKAPPLQLSSRRIDCLGNPLGAVPTNNDGGGT